MSKWTRNIHCATLEGIDKVLKQVCGSYLQLTFRADYPQCGGDFGTDHGDVPSGHIMHLRANVLPLANGRGWKVVGQLA